MNHSSSRLAAAFALLLITAGSVVAQTCDASESKPNIVFILADDLGYGDLGCYGHPSAETPNLDRLAREGVRMTQHYSNGPECSPTRTAFLTGRYQQRIGGLECAIGTGNVGRYDDAIRLAEQRDLGLPADSTVIPRSMIQSGYACAVFGKWHLGYEPKFYPLRHGWNDFFGYLGGNVHYFNHRETSSLHVLFDGNLPVYRDGYMTKLITDEAIEFIETQDGPFFLFVSHETPHFPYQGPSDEAKVVTAENWMEIDPQAYVSMLEDLDDEVGRILKTLKSRGFSDNTLVVFASDNGGFAGAAHMGPLQGAKGTTLEGGIRVPMIARWPSKIPSGVVSDQVCVTFDLTKSFLRIAGIQTEDVPLDGFDVIEHLENGQPSKPRTLYWRGRRGKRTWKAVRENDWKLVQKTEGDDNESWLYDLSSDKGEQNDRSAEKPDIKKRLNQMLIKWEAEVAPKR